MRGNRRSRLIRMFFLVLTLICLIMIGREYYLSAGHRAQRDALKEKAAQSENSDFGGAEAEDISVMTDADAENADISVMTDADTENADISVMTDADAENADISAAPDADTESAGEPGAADAVSSAKNGENGQEPDGGYLAQDGGNMPSAGSEEPSENDGNGTPEASRIEVLQKYAALKRENSHFAGWLFIEGTGIDYPVMQCEDDEYYLHHDFYGKESRYGCLYVRERADLEAGTNFVIYGHNMRDGAMFGNLDYYLKERFFKEHPTISFDTLYEERVYEIVAVFRSQVYNAEDDVFKYYQFYQAETEEEFEDFYTNIKALSIYDTGVEAEFGDTFLTCSTCAYHVEDGRFVIVAKRVE